LKIKCPFSNLNGCQRVFDEYHFDMTMHLRKEHGDTWTYVTSKYVRLLRKIHEKIESFENSEWAEERITQELKSLLEDKN